ncbi:MAG: tRNA 2-thiouridine(34) synthase MnmA [Pseudomonadota bacterium]
MRNLATCQRANRLLKTDSDAYGWGVLRQIWAIAKERIRAYVPAVMSNDADIPEISLDLPADTPKGAPVIVAMSGGVDSSVAAALVARAGYQAIGVTLQLYDHGVAIQKKGACCAGQDIQDARNVAAKLGIPHYVLDYEDRFSEAVMEDFADTYLAGATPIPCVRCNERVKFRDLMETARDLGGVAMVTGHYVRRAVGANGPELRRAADPTKDQSYFLFATTREQLDFLRFPLGGLDKDETRAIAAALELPVADKPDSQDICFVPEGKYASVVERLRPGAAEPGEIVDINGNVLGRHAGVIHYTVGQRRGLGVAVGDPLYVVKVDAAARRVIVGPREALQVKRIQLKDVSWIGDGALQDAIASGAEIAVKVRSTRPPSRARFIIGSAGVEDRRASVELFDAEEGVAPGQACVFYSSEDGHNRVLGGGWIASAESAFNKGGLALPSEFKKGSTAHGEETL